MATTEPKKGEIVTCDFEIRGKVPEEAFELFAAAQAKLLGIRGYIKKVADGVYKGTLEGSGKVVEAFKQVLTMAGEYVAAIKEFIIKNLKTIENYNYDKFEVRK